LGFRDRLYLKGKRERFLKRQTGCLKRFDGMKLNHRKYISISEVISLSYNMKAKFLKFGRVKNVAENVWKLQEQKLKIMKLDKIIIFYCPLALNVIKLSHCQVFVP